MEILVCYQFQSTPFVRVNKIVVTQNNNNKIDVHIPCFEHNEESLLEDRRGTNGDTAAKCSGLEICQGGV